MIKPITNKAMLIILSAPSGGGKTSIAKKLLKEDANLSLSISATTRKPRSGEQEGVDYFFVNRAEFDLLIAEDQLLESAEIYYNLYGTPKKNVERVLASGADLLFDIDSQGAYQIMNKMQERVLSIFILPPDIATLRERLEARGQDDIETLNLRIKLAQEEMEHAKNYQHVVINDNFDKAIHEIQAIIHKERQKREMHEDR